MNAFEIERKFPLWRVFACIAVLISWSVVIKWGFQMDRSVGGYFAVLGRENPFILRFFYHFIGFAIWLVIPFCFSTQKSIAVFARNIGLIDRIELSACLYSGGAMVGALLAIGAIRLGIARGSPDAKHYFQGGELVWSGYLLIAILIGPIIEEVVTRGFLYGQLRQRLSIPKCIVLVLAFSLYFHWEIVTTNPVFAFLLVMNGICLCAIREKTKSLWNCVLYHGVYNATVAHQWTLIVTVISILVLLGNSQGKVNSSQSTESLQ